VTFPAPPASRAITAQPSVRVIDVNVTGKSSAIQMDSSVAAPVLAAVEVTKSVPTVQQPTVAMAKTMPFAIRNWLNHLEQIERRRRDLSFTQLAELITDFTKLSAGDASRYLAEAIGEDEGSSKGNEPAIREFAKKAGRLREAWIALRRDYNAVPVPRECMRIDGSYTVALSQTGQMAREVLDQLELGLKEPNEAVATLMKLRGTSGGRIDNHAAEADKGIQLLCDEFSVSKWFSIGHDFGGEFGKLASGWSP